MQEQPSTQFHDEQHDFAGKFQILLDGFCYPWIQPRATSCIHAQRLTSLVTTSLVTKCVANVNEIFNKTTFKIAIENEYILIFKEKRESCGRFKQVTSSEALETQFRLFTRRLNFSDVTSPSCFRPFAASSHPEFVLKII